MNLKQQREAALQAAREIAERVKSEGRGFTPEEQQQVDAHLAKADELNTQIKAADQADAIMAKLGSFGDPGEKSGDADAEAPTLGEHFVKHVGHEGLRRVKTIGGCTVAAPEWRAKANTDTQST